jgi:hypothetical protein
LSEDEVEVGGGGLPLESDIELEELIELTGAEGTVGKGLWCVAGPPKMELAADDDIVAGEVGVEGWYNRWAMTEGCL